MAEKVIPLANRKGDTGKTTSSAYLAQALHNRRLRGCLLTRWSARFNISREVHDLLKERKMPLLDARIRQLTRYTEFTTPSYLEEYEAVLGELAVI